MSVQRVMLEISWIKRFPFSWICLATMPGKSQQKSLLPNGGEYLLAMFDGGESHGIESVKNHQLNKSDPKWLNKIKTNPRNSLNQTL